MYETAFVTERYNNPAALDPLDVVNFPTIGRFRACIVGAREDRILREEDLVTSDPVLSENEREKWEDMLHRWETNDETLKSFFENITKLKKSSIKGLYAEYIWCWVRKKLWTRAVKKETWGDIFDDHGRGIFCPLCRENEIETVEHINL
eukprot:Nk52_evm1s1508 gene=Nk52_evmTU1s1508